jgi:hypothetical protein
MLFIVLVAIQLVFFQGVWQILMVPPFTIIVLTLNLGLLFLVVRPPALERRIVGMLLGGLAAFVAILALIFNSIPYQRSRLGPAGLVGKLVDDTLVPWLTGLPDQQSATARVLEFIIVNIVIIDFVILDVLGVALIWAGGWIESRLRRRWVRARAPGMTVFPPLDDGAATPL